MFHRLTFESWTSIVPIIAFALTFATFIMITIRAIFMKKKDVDKLANLPLSNGKPAESKQAPSIEDI